MRFYMEDVLNTTRSITDDILHELCEANIPVDTLLEDKIWEAIQKHLENLCGSPNYKQQNG